MGLALGIDTSNYKTSIALIDRDDNIFYDDRRFLRVQEGSLGLRQQEAFFQHVNRLPRMIRPMMETLREVGESIDVISVSNKPRNIADSYMPCFEAGVALGEVLSSTLNIPIVKYSHQEGHIEAGKRFTPLRDSNNFIAFHFSGGTTEALHYDKRSGSRPNIEIVGGTKDISFGQLIDRVGLAMGYSFPAGEELDNGAIRYGSGNIIYDTKDSMDIWTQRDASHDLQGVFKINVKEPYINLSGTETSILRYLKSQDDINRDMVSYHLFREISKAIYKMTEALYQDTGIKDFLFVGGVSGSSFIRSNIEKMAREKEINPCFASPDLASDNAVGIAFLGGDSIWL